MQVLVTAKWTYKWGIAWSHRKTREGDVDPNGETARVSAHTEDALARFTKGHHPWLMNYMKVALPP